MEATVVTAPTIQIHLLILCGAAPLLLVRLADICDRLSKASALSMVRWLLPDTRLPPAGRNLHSSSEMQTATPALRADGLSRLRIG